MTPTIKQFDTERELADYADSLNEAGLTREIALMDSAGNSALATPTPPAIDGPGFAYYAVDAFDDGRIEGEHAGGWIKARRYVDSYGEGTGWEPTWPVFGLVSA